MPLGVAPIEVPADAPYNAPTQRFITDKVDSHEKRLQTLERSVT